MTINLTALQKQRRDTAANWTGANPTLLAGEIGIESDTNKIKIGDGSTAWTSLAYRPWSQISAYPIVNADVASAAAISYSKLATLTSGNIVLGSSSNVATSTAVTGDVTISNTGVTAIATGVIVNADINASAAIADTKLGTISTALKVSNSATTATDANTASAIVARDASGNFTAGTITANLTGTASNVTTNANLTGDVTSVGNATTIAAGVIVDADINASAAIVDTKLATIATAGKVSNSATTATSANTASAIVARDASGNFTAGTITAALTGTASGNLVSGGALGTPSSGTLTNCTFPTLNQNTTGNAATVTTNANLTGDVTSVGNATTIAAGVIVDADVNASAAIAGTKVAPDFGSQTVITTGSALIGTATSLSTLYSGAGKLQAASNDATTIQSYAFSSTGVDYSATLELSRARNTQASPAIVVNGDYIGQINFAGYNTNFQRGATIYALVDGEPGTAGDTTDMPGKLVFATTPNGSATPTTAMTIDSSQRVGIGTSAATSTLHIQHAAQTANYWEGKGLLIHEDATANQGIAFYSRGSNEQYIASLIDDDTSYLIIGARKSSSTNGVDALCIRGSGNVGIGSTGPQGNLHIADATRANIIIKKTGLATIQNSTLSSNYDNIQLGAGGSFLSYNVETATADTHIGHNFYRHSGGDFKYKYTDAVARIKFNSSAGETIFDRAASGSANTNITFSESMRLDASGRLLVGTASALTGSVSQYSKLTVVGNTSSASNGAYFAIGRGTAGTSFSSGTDIGQIFWTDNAGAEFASIAGAADGTCGAGDFPGRLVFSTTADGASSPTERMRIHNDGRISTGTTSAPGASSFGFSINRTGSQGLLECYRNVGNNAQTAIIGGSAGEAYIEGDGDLKNTNNSYGAISDQKLKENIVDASSQWVDIKALQVRRYNFKEETGYNTHTQIGLVAQEVELVSPGLVSESPDRDEDGNDLGTVTKSVNYSVLYMKAVKALQEAMGRIETLEQRLTAAGID